MKSPSKLKIISKKQANDVLSRKKRAPYGYGGGGDSIPPKTGRKYHDVGQECILKECTINDLFKQNIYSNEEYENSKLEEDHEQGLRESGRNVLQARTGGFEANPRVTGRNFVL